eukprot:CAMPEP_0115828716 /NCGR_PEP_ID=MMETSP0287-20121206/719_1 /TAXON_ID=412157 /ORGANISM="Chrysochromulina rotalis, Strain UIO044" /LENGTH=161 /DNA_ID=CAMNT_0003281945 /DNA_START=39 /DNA_END=524 /DNA_ORIENTATION=-
MGASINEAACLPLIYAHPIDLMNHWKKFRRWGLEVCTDGGVENEEHGPIRQRCRPPVRWIWECIVWHTVNSPGDGIFAPFDFIYMEIVMPICGALAPTDTPVVAVCLARTWPRVVLADLSVMVRALNGTIVLVIDVLHDINLTASWPALGGILGHHPMRCV